MAGWVLAVGLLVTGISGYLLVRVQAMAGLLDRVFGSRWLYGAALLRLLMGAALIASADASRYPQAIELFGWLFVLGGLILVVVPVPVLTRISGWFGALSPAMSRVWLSGALLFGLFLVYAAIA